MFNQIGRAILKNKLITQKQGLKNILQGLSHDFRLLFVYNWLEDINWHTEASYLAEIAYNDPGKMEWLELIKYVNDPGAYSYEYVQEQVAKLPKAALIQLQMVKESKQVVPVNGTLVNKEDLIYMRRAENYSPFCYTFGWGLDKKDWTSDGYGRPFVDELLEIINEK